MRSKIKAYFITGLIAVVPIALTGYILWALITLMDGFLNLLPPKLHPSTYLEYEIPGLGLIMTIILIFIVGVITRSVLGKKLVGIGEWIVGKIPMVRTIYQAAKQLSEAIFLPKSEGFRRVVLIEYPRRGINSLGFVTGETRGEVQDRTPSKVLNIFVPTTPNPTSGYYIVVPEKDTIPLSMTVEDAFKLIISGGMVAPPSPRGGPIPIEKYATMDESAQETAGADAELKDENQG